MQVNLNSWRGHKLSLGNTGGPTQFMREKLDSKFILVAAETLDEVLQVKNLCMNGFSIVSAIVHNY